jgi:hypothetical protein
MNLFKDFLKTSRTHEHLLSALMLIYIALDVQTPIELAPMVNNIFFKLLLGVVIIAMFFYVNPLVGILAVLTGYTFMYRSRVLGADSIPNEKVKHELMKTFNAPKASVSSVSLEEEVVKKMVPTTRPPLVDNTNFQPILSDTHNASSLADGK